MISYSPRFYAPLVVAQILAWGGMFALWVFGYLHIRSALHLDEADAIRWMGVGMALYVALGAALNFALPEMYRRLGLVRTHAAALLCGGVGLVLVAHALSPCTLLLGYAVTSLGWASLSNTPYALVSARVTDGRYALAMARFNLSVIAPQVILALALSWLIARVAPATAIFDGGIAMILGSMVMLAVPEAPTRS